MDKSLLMMDIFTGLLEELMQLPKLRLREGFAGQTMFVIPRPVLAEVRSHPLVRSVYPTDIGWFPNAAHHYRDRPNGAHQDHLMLCISGRGHLEIADQRVQLNAGEMIVIPRETPHSYWADERDPWSIYWVHFLGDDSDYFVNRVGQPGQPVHISRASSEEAVGLFRYCLSALNDGYGLPTLIYAAQSTRHILSLLLYRNRALLQEPSAGAERSIVATVIRFMYENLDKPLRLNDLARASGASVSHFSERFRAQTGQSPMSYFIQLKIRLACRLLDLSGKPVKVVASETGYRDPYYFSRVFKKCMGMSPDHYRAIKKG